MGDDALFHKVSKCPPPPTVETATLFASASAVETGAPAVLVATVKMLSATVANRTNSIARNRDSVPGAVQHPTYRQVAVRILTSARTTGGKREPFISVLTSDAKGADGLVAAPKTLDVPLRPSPASNANLAMRPPAVSAHVNCSYTE